MWEFYYTWGMNGSLYLSPVHPEQQPDPSAIWQGLAELQIGDKLLAEAPGKRVYSAGSGFTRHVIYAGCSPHLRFEPQTPHDRDFCHLALLGPFQQPQIITGENTVNPRCPHCRSRLTDWPAWIHTKALRCPECGSHSPPWQLDWCHQAAAGRYFIELRNVFPGEASPSDQLLANLAHATEMGWGFAWAGMSGEP